MFNVGIVEVQSVTVIQKMNSKEKNKPPSSK